MSDLIEISASEHGRVRVFALEYALAMEISHTGGLDRLCRALGVAELQDADVQIVQVEAITDMGLVAFLSEAYGVEADEIAPYAEALRALTGTVAILRSGAFGAKPGTLIPDGEARLVATLTEPNPAIPPMSPLISESAEGTLAQNGGKAGPSDAAISGRIATMVLIFLGLFVWFLIRISG
jgi:hypothetical protein